MQKNPSTTKSFRFSTLNLLASEPSLARFRKARAKGLRGATPTEEAALFTAFLMAERLRRSEARAICVREVKATKNLRLGEGKKLYGYNALFEYSRARLGDFVWEADYFLSDEEVAQVQAFIGS